MNDKSDMPYEKEDSDFGLPQNSFDSLASNRSSRSRIAIVSLCSLVAVGLGAFYFVFYHLPGSHLKEKPSFIGKDHESRTPEEDSSCLDSGESLDEERIETDDVPPSFASSPRKGTVTRISTPQGCYYAILGSYIDEDLASDYAAFLAGQGVDTVVITPTPGENFYYVAVGQADSSQKARENAKPFESFLGDIWIKKY